MLSRNPSLSEIFKQQAELLERSVSRAVFGFLEARNIHKLSLINPVVLVDLGGQAALTIDTVCADGQVGFSSPCEDETEPFTDLTLENQLEILAQLESGDWDVDQYGGNEGPSELLQAVRIEKQKDCPAMVVEIHTVNGSKDAMNGKFVAVIDHIKLS